MALSRRQEAAQRSFEKRMADRRRRAHKIKTETFFCFGGISAEEVVKQNWGFCGEPQYYRGGIPRDWQG